MRLLTRQRLVTAAAALLLFGAVPAGCGGGSGSSSTGGTAGNPTTASGAKPRFFWEGPASEHPRWEAAEILVEEAEELKSKFDGLRPTNLHGRLAVLAQLEELDRGCVLGYGISDCRRQPALWKETKRLYEAIVPESRRHSDLPPGAQVAVMRFRLAQRRHEGFAARRDGVRAYFVLDRAYGQCKGIPTCPYQRAGRIKARLARELFASH